MKEEKPDILIFNGKPVKPVVDPSVRKILEDLQKQVSSMKKNSK